MTDRPVHHLDGARLRPVGSPPPPPPPARSPGSRRGIPAGSVPPRPQDLGRIVEELLEIVIDDLSTEVRRRTAENLEPLSGMLRRRRAEATIAGELQRRYRTGAGLSGRLLSEAEEAEIAARVIEQVFSRRPALERLLERTDVTDIFHNGPRDARVKTIDGQLHRIEPLFSSDADMVTFVQAIARSGGRLETGDDLFADHDVSGGALEQEFSETRPSVDLRLMPSGARLTAQGPWVTLSGTHISIRKHPLIDADQNVLVYERQMYDPGLASFLAAAVLLGWGILIAGRPGAGKTTLMRALAHELAPDTRIIQIEQNPELGLERNPALHNHVLPWIERAANMEGRGGVSLDYHVLQTQRHAPERVIVGEVRGAEAMSLLEALTLGVPGMCTMHSTSALNILSRLVHYAKKGDSSLAADHVLRSAAEGLDLVVYLDEAVDGRKVISEVLHIGEFDEVSQRPITDQWFVPDAQGCAVRNIKAPIPAQVLRKLQIRGYDDSLHPDSRSGGGW